MHFRKTRYFFAHSKVFKDMITGKIDFSTDELDNRLKTLDRKYDVHYRQYKN